MNQVLNLAGVATAERTCGIDDFDIRKSVPKRDPLAEPSCPVGCCPKGSAPCHDCWYNNRHYRGAGIPATYDVPDMVARDLFVRAGSKMHA